MPHINIKYFPIELGEDVKKSLSNDLAKVISKYFNCKEDVISILLEETEENLWYKEVYEAEIIKKRHLLCKLPNY